MNKIISKIFFLDGELFEFFHRVVPKVHYPLLRIWGMFTHAGVFIYDPDDIKVFIHSTNLIFYTYINCKLYFVTGSSYFKSKYQ